MNTSLIAIALALSSAATFAKTPESAMTGNANQSHVEFVREGDGLVPKYITNSTTTRAEVIAELKASQARMDWVRSGDELLPRAMFTGAKTVAEVQAEFNVARRTGQLSARSRSNYGDSSL